MESFLQSQGLFFTFTQWLALYILYSVMLFFFKIYIYSAILIFLEIHAGKDLGVHAVAYTVDLSNGVWGK
jgi:hypothetical protein